MKSPEDIILYKYDINEKINIIKLRLFLVDNICINCIYYFLNVATLK